MVNDVIKSRLDFLKENEEGGNSYFKNRCKDTPGGILSKLFREIVIEDGHINLINSYVSRYCNNIKDSNVIGVNKKVKSTLLNNIEADEMTIKVFMDLMLNFLNIKNMKLSVSIEYANKVVKHHEVFIVSTGEKNDEE